MLTKTSGVPTLGTATTSLDLLPLHAWFNIIHTTKAHDPALHVIPSIGQWGLHIPVKPAGSETDPRPRLPRAEPREEHHDQGRDRPVPEAVGRGAGILSHAEGHVSIALVLRQCCKAARSKLQRVCPPDSLVVVQGLDVSRDLDRVRGAVDALGRRVQSQSFLHREPSSV